MFTGETPSPLSLVGRRGGKVTYALSRLSPGRYFQYKFYNCFKCIENPFIIIIAEVMPVKTLKTHGVLKIVKEPQVWRCGAHNLRGTAWC